ncbi:metal-dependent hydrolase [Dactylosporangium fulvum]|uniref:Metal-dependent hydrolase n=1 Tax=Dactylosporangium fulvum TaxID=53359 RepID=A0ABY5WE61_9ACTN|nr:metal-dependent hydrolase [Dactylosporangium fulvum]UWP87401.1 metal-dependent hydrolase [Dactylosporangium fulvum]
MMGSSHALSGAAVWLGGSLALDQLADFHQTPLQLAVGTAICAGGALLPDLDLSGRVTARRGGATVAQTFGVLSLFLAECVEKFSLGVYKLTRMKRDPQRRNGHRTLTHTIVFNVGVGYGTLALCNAYGKWAVMGVLFFSFALALRGLFEKWAERAGWLIVTLSAAGAAYLVYERLPGDRGYPLLGVAVGVGGLVHLAGDMLTRHGCPIFWPIPTGRRMWRNIGLPDSIALVAGNKTETVFLRTVFATIAIFAGAVLVLPTLLERFNIIG